MSNTTQLKGDAVNLQEVFNEFKRDLLNSFHQKELQQVVDSSINESLAKKEDFITRKETAQKLQCSYPTLKSWVKYGYLNSYKIGRRVYFLESEVISMIKKFKTI